MPTEPHRTLLDRNLYPALAKEHFGDSLGLLEELVNYGSNLVPRCFVSSQRELHDVVIILNFLKQGVALLDSIHLLAAQGATIPCFISLRSLFEVSVYLDWVFESETRKRGTLYFVWNLRRKLHWTLSVKQGTPEHEAHKLHMKDAAMGATVAAGEQLIDAEIDLLKKKLSAPECAAIDAEFERRRKGSMDREWYVPGGVSNFREMARTVKREGEYKVFYSYFSCVTHGLAFEKHASFSDGKVVFESIRNLAEMHTIFRNAFNLAISIFRRVLSHYRPGEVENFDRKYISEWRERFWAVKHVEYKNGTYTFKTQAAPKLDPRIARVMK